MTVPSPPETKQNHHDQDDPSPRAQRQFARSYTPVPLGLPTAQVLVVTCLDHRVDPAIVFGLRLGEAPVIRNAGGRVTPAVIDDIAFLAYLAEQLSGQPGPADTALRSRGHPPHAMRNRLSRRPQFRRQAAGATGLPEATLEASAVADPHRTVKADVAPAHLTAALTEGQRLRSRDDIATGRVTTTLDARYP